MTRLRLVEAPVLLIDLVTGAVATLVGLAVGRRHGLERGFVSTAANSRTQLVSSENVAGGWRYVLGDVPGASPAATRTTWAEDRKRGATA